MSKHHSMSTKQRRARMRQLHLLQDGLCAHCWTGVHHPEAPGRPARNAFLEASLDHVVARSRGGSNLLTNLLLTHRGCNEDRSDGELPEPARRMWQRNIARLAEAQGLAA